MFANYMVLALFLFSLVSALDVLVPLPVRVGTSLKLDVTTVPGDPTNIDLLLCASDGQFAISLATNVTVAHTIAVHIPSTISRKFEYFIAAIQVGNRGIIYSKSNVFEVDSGRRVGRIAPGRSR